MCSNRLKNFTAKAAVIFCCFCFLCFYQSAAQSATLYKNRKLIADNSLQLTQLDFKAWQCVADSIINNVEQGVHYPQPWIENCISPVRVILSLTYRDDSLYLDIVKSNYSEGTAMVLNNLKALHLERFFDRRNFKKHRSYHFYLPLQWSFKDIKPCEAYFKAIENKQPLYHYQLSLANITWRINNGWISLEADIRLIYTEDHM